MLPVGHLDVRRLPPGRAHHDRVPLRDVGRVDRADRRRPVPADGDAAVGARALHLVGPARASADRAAPGCATSSAPALSSNIDLVVARASSASARARSSCASRSSSCRPGSLYGTWFSASYTRPRTTGWSGSPSKKPTITSCPTRGSTIIPKPASRPSPGSRGPSRSCSRRTGPRGPRGTARAPARARRCGSPRPSGPRRSRSARR